MLDLKSQIIKYDKVIYIKDDEYFENIYIDAVQNRSVLIIGTKSFLLEDKNVDYEIITTKEAEELEALYYSYEFTDNFLLLTNTNARIADIFNFVKTGLLSCEEAWQALMY